MLLKLEKLGKAVLVYLDESYCNIAHPNTHSWHIYILVIPFKISRPQEAGFWSSFMPSQRMVLCALLTWPKNGLLMKSNERAISLTSIIHTSKVSAMPLILFLWIPIYSGYMIRIQETNMITWMVRYLWNLELLRLWTSLRFLLKMSKRERMIGMCLRTFSGGRTAMVVLSQTFFRSF